MIFIMVIFSMVSAQVFAKAGDIDSKPKFKACFDFDLATIKPKQEKSVVRVINQDSFKVPKGLGMASYTVITLTDSSGTVKYPKISGLKNIGIENKINKKIKEHATYFDTSGAPSNVTNDVECTVTYNCDDLFSIKYLHSPYYEGAAHPDSYLTSQVFNLKNGNELTLKDFFKPFYNYKDVVDAYLSKINTDPNFDFLFRPMSGISNEEHFYLNNSGFMFYFQPYDYTPYAYGPLELVVPYSEFESNLLFNFSYSGCSK